MQLVRVARSIITGLLRIIIFQVCSLRATWHMHIGRLILARTLQHNARSSVSFVVYLATLGGVTSRALGKCR